MKITKKQLKQLIRENLLLEFSPTWFAAKKGGAMVSFLTSFFNDDEAGMISAAKNIAKYYDGDCEEMKEDIEEVTQSQGLINAMISIGTPMIKAIDLKDKTIDPDLFDKILTKEVVGCDKDVIDKLKNLGFIFADKLIATGDFEDYKIAKDYKAGKFDFLKS